jgi:hypothetical protein
MLLLLLNKKLINAIQKNPQILSTVIILNLNYLNSPADIGDRT